MAEGDGTEAVDGAESAGTENNTDSDPGAVFISYASQDAAAAQKLCMALRAAGIEVWFDQSELRGGEAWDATIKKQIKSCALFIPIISVNTSVRTEGYFRLEWKLAVDRSHLMALGWCARGQQSKGRLYGGDGSAPACPRARAR